MPRSESPTGRMLREFAGRRPNENDLSDMFFAAMRVSRDLTALVCRIAGVTDFADYIVQREVPIDNGRLDLLIDTYGHSERQRVAVEVKLADPNYHFEAYSSSAACRNAKMLLITNHVLPAEHRRTADKHQWKAILWSDVLDRTDEAIDKGLLGHEASAVADFCSYARAVCKIARGAQMKFDIHTLDSLNGLRSLLEETMKATNIPGCRLEIDSSSYGRGHYGLYCRLYADGGQWAKLFAGLTFGSGDVWCGIELERSNNQDIFHRLRQRSVEASNPQWFSASDNLWATLFEGQKGLEEFSAKPFEDQKRQVAEFCERVNAWLASQLAEAGTDT